MNYADMELDREVRLAAFAFLAEQINKLGEVVPEEFSPSILNFGASEFRLLALKVSSNLKSCQRCRSVSKPRPRFLGNRVLMMIGRPIKE